MQAGLQTQALLQLAGGGGNSKEKTPKINFPKMSADDDAQAFLEAFEVAAEAYHWLREEWVVRLLPLLSGEAQQAAHRLSPCARAHNVNVRKAVLDRTGYSPEEQRRQFRGAGPGNGGPPLRLCATADRPGKEVAAAGDMLGGRRIRAGGPGAVSGGAAHGHGGLGTMPPALQSRGRRNFGRGSPRPAPRPHAGGEAGASASKEASPSFGARRLSPGARATSTWCFTPFFFFPPSPRLRDGPSRPAGSASDARTRVLAVRTAGPLPPRVPAHGGVAGGPGGWPAYLCSWFGGGAYCIPVRVQVSEHRALLDSGAMQSLIRQSLVRPEALVMAPCVTIRCMHGDEHSYPIVSVEINLQGQTHIIKAAVSTRLSHPLILGTDWPGFRQVVKDQKGVRSRQLGRCEVCAVDSGDVGSSDTAERGPGSVGLPAEALRAPDFPPMEDFPLKQSRDDTLRFAFD